MNLRFHWFLPTSGDGRAIAGPDDRIRPPLPAHT
jgi:hypothetical protein